MAIDPIGQNTYKGLGVPLHGESVIRKQNTSNAGLTLMHSADNTGRFLMGMDYQLDKESSISMAVCDIDAEGGFRGVSGTTVKMEMNTSGLFVGSSGSINQDTGKYAGQMTRKVTTVAAATTNITATSGAGSGALYYFLQGRSTICFITLPATPAVGDNYEVISNSTVATEIVVMTAATGAAQGFYLYKSTGVFATTAGCGCGTSGLMHFRFTALTSGSMWAVANLGGGDNTTTVMSNPVTASTTT